MQLDKYLAQMSMGTRSEVKKFIKSGRKFLVNGAPASGPRTRRQRGQCGVGRREGLLRKYVYYMLNKPQGVVSPQRTTPAGRYCP